MYYFNEWLWDYKIEMDLLLITSLILLQLEGAVQVGWIVSIKNINTSLANVI